MLLPLKKGKKNNKKETSSTKGILDNNHTPN